MKKYLLAFMALIVLTSLSFAQTDLIQSITDGLKSNSINTLLETLGDDVQITILEEEDSYEKAKGGEILSGFFNSFSTEDYKLKHTGESADGSEFVIGELTQEEQLYRIYFVVNAQKVTEFCIELD